MEATVDVVTGAGERRAGVAVQVAFARVRDTLLELVPAASPDPAGIHVCFVVDDVAASLGDLGALLISKHGGAPIAGFFDGRHTAGLRVELLSRAWAGEIEQRLAEVSPTAGPGAGD